jgi:hypothetical protein
MVFAVGLQELMNAVYAKDLELTLCVQMAVMLVRLNIVKFQDALMRVPATIMKMLPWMMVVVSLQKKIMIVLVTVLHLMHVEFVAVIIFSLVNAGMDSAV